MFPVPRFVMYRWAPGYASIYGRPLRQALDRTLIHPLAPRHDPAPATKLLAPHNPALGSTTKLLKGLSPWVARHVLGTQPFHNSFAVPRRNLPHTEWGPCSAVVIGTRVRISMGGIRDSQAQAASAIASYLAIFQRSEHRCTAIAKPSD